MLAVTGLVAAAVLGGEQFRLAEQGLDGGRDEARSLGRALPEPDGRAD
jgi:hypothetical protein